MSKSKNIKHIICLLYRFRSSLKGKTQFYILNDYVYAEDFFRIVIYDCTQIIKC